MQKFRFACLALTLASSVSVNGALASHRRAHGVPRSAPAAKKAVSFRSGGKVLLPDGSPAAGAILTLAWMTQNGTFQFSKLPANGDGTFHSQQKLSNTQPNFMAQITAYVPGKGWATYQGASADGHFRNLTLRVQPGALLTGHAVNADGTPAANTEIYVETIFSSGMNGNTVVFAQQSFDGAMLAGQVGTANLQLTPYDSMMRLLPDGTMPKLFHTRTDSAGKFEIVGLPRMSSLILRTSGEAVLTPGSMKSIALDGAARADAGILVVTRLGSARVRVLDSATHRPAASVAGSLSAADIGFNGMVLYHGRPPFAAQADFRTDKNGTAEVKNLAPGAYRIDVLGQTREIKVEPGTGPAAVEYTLRQGPLKGRLLDASGRPLANTAIVMTTAPALNFLGSRFAGRFQDDSRASTGWEQQPVSQTDADGRFILPEFPWGSTHVIIRATKGCDRAEYNGLIASIGSGLELKMKRGALVTVTGRLIDPHRRPVTNIACQALHWQSTPRATWFASAHPVQADKQGRFRIAGLERGESFSVIANGAPAEQFQRAQAQSRVTTAGIRTAALKIPDVHDFESPRFVTKQAGAVQEMGELMVHPSNTPDEVLQVYGAMPQVASTGVIQSPPAADAARAQDALGRYSRALKTGDVKTVYALTSRLAPEYAPRLSDFLLRAGLSSGANGNRPGEARGALHYVPRSLITGILSRSAASRAAAADGLASRPDDLLNTNMVVDFRSRSFPGTGVPSNADSAPVRANDWVVLTANKHDTMVMSSILHREDGGWKVVSSSPAGNLPLTALAGFFGGAPPQTAEYTRPAPAISLAQFAAARAAGENYLHAWAANHLGSMQKQTSMASAAYTSDLDQFKKNLEHRPDDGVCPMNPENRIVLEPMNGLTVWDRKWLFELARSRGITRPSFNGLSITVAEVNSSGADEGDNLALLKYSAPTGHYVMALARQNHEWKVIEPALPL